MAKMLTSCKGCGWLVSRAGGVGGCWKCGNHNNRIFNGFSQPDSIPDWCRLPDAPHWVSVSEESPHKHDLYDVIVTYGERRYEAQLLWDLESGIWLFSGWAQPYLNITVPIGSVTHWLKGMPALPKED